MYDSGAKEVHIGTGCPPIVFGCKYLNFSRSSSEMELITRRVIAEREGWDIEDMKKLGKSGCASDCSSCSGCGKIPSAQELKQTLTGYTDPESGNYKEMVESIRKQLGFTSLAFTRLDDMCTAVGIDKNKLCTYCWNGKE